MSFKCNEVVWTVSHDELSLALEEHEYMVAFLKSNVLEPLFLSSSDSYIGKR